MHSSAHSGSQLGLKKEQDVTLTSSFRSEDQLGGVLLGQVRPSKASRGACVGKELGKLRVLALSMLCGSASYCDAPAP
jgi:hypothetical protein